MWQLLTGIGVLLILIWLFGVVLVLTGLPLTSPATLLLWLIAGGIFLIGGLLLRGKSQSHQ